MRRSPVPALLALLVATALTAAFAPGAGAKDCTPQAFAAERDHATLVFLGFAESVRDTLLPAIPGKRPEAQRAQKTRFRMLSIWKGVPRRELDVLAVPGDASRGPAAAFAAGETYLVYARESGTTTSVHPCSRSAAMDAAADDLAALGKPTVVQRIPARKPAKP